MKRKTKIFNVILGFIMLAVPMVLQAQITTGTLRGHVTEENGEPLPGVTIEIESESLMTPRSSVTDMRGFYRFLYMPPGRYTICAKLEGFDTYWLRGVPVQVAKTSTANVEMKMGELEETIEVTAEAPVIDTETSARSYNINSEMIATVPIAPRMNYFEVWLTLPGVSGLYGTNAIVNASTITKDVEPNKSYFLPGNNQDDSYENKILIDGMDVNDQMSGQLYVRLNYDCIQEVDIKTAGAPAEYGNARSAFMNIITKSGGNNFHGSFIFQYQPMSFNTTNVEGTSAKKTSYAIPSFTLSGPIMKDKIWFMASYRYDTENYQYPNTIVVDKIIRETRSHMPLLKLTFQPHKDHTISLTYQSDVQVIDNALFPSTTRSTLETARYKDFGGPMASGTWRWIITDSIFFNFTAGYNYKARDQFAVTQEPRLRYTSEYRGTTMSYEQGAGEEYYSIRANALISGHLTWFVDDLWKTGSHEIKIGTEFRPYGHVTRTRKYWEDEYGFFHYRLGLDYENYGLSEPYIWEAQERFPGDRYDNEYVVSGQSFYIRDNWAVSKNLTLQLGLRYERSRMNMFFRNELPDWFAEISPRIHENVMFDDKGIAPRLGLTYNWEGVGVFKLHYGRYFEHIGGSVGSYPRTIATNTYRMDEADFGKGPEALKIYSQGALAYSATVMDEDLKMEHNNEFVASFERELFWDLALETSFIYRKTYRMGIDEVNAVFEDGQFVDRIWPELDGIMRKATYYGDDRIHDFTYKGLQFNLKRNFVGQWGAMINYTFMWRSYNKLRWAQGEVDQFVYANPSDLSMENYGVNWVFHASVFYRFPWDIMVSAYVSGQSGRWMNDISGDYEWNDDAPRVYLSNGRRVSDIVWQANNSYYVGRKYGLQGRMTDQLWSFNVRLSKGIKISRFRVEASADFYSILNSATYDTWYTLDIRNPRYDEERNPQSPRSVQLNLTIKF